MKMHIITLGKKSAIGDLLLNLIRLIPLIFVMMFLLNIFGARLPKVVERLDEIKFYALGYRIVFSHDVTKSFAVIDVNSLKPRVLKDLFADEDLLVCFNITYLPILNGYTVKDEERSKEGITKQNGLFVCNDKDYEYEFYNYYRRMPKQYEKYSRKKVYSFDYFSNVYLNSRIFPAKIHAIFIIKD